MELYELPSRVWRRQLKLCCAVSRNLSLVLDLITLPARWLKDRRLLTLLYYANEEEMYMGKTSWVTATLLFALIVTSDRTTSIVHATCGWGCTTGCNDGAEWWNGNFYYGYDSAWGNTISCAASHNSQSAEFITGLYSCTVWDIGSGTCSAQSSMTPGTIGSGATQIGSASGQELRVSCYNGLGS